MAATVGSINVLFTVNYNGYQQGVTRAADVTETQGRRITKAVANVDRSTQQLNRSIGSIRSREFRVLSLAALRTKDSVERLRNSMVAVAALAGGFGAAFTAKGLMEYSDTYKQVGNRLRTVKMEAQELAHLEQTIYETAQKSRATYESTGILFSRIAGASRRLAISQKDVLRVTETIQKAFVVGGSTPIEATQSAIQLSQGIASNRLQGDELRSVLENPALGQLLADKISGGDLGALRKMAADGELTASVVVKAFKEASKEIDRLFANTEQTIGQAFVAVDRAILRYVGTSDLAKAASDGLVGVLNAVAQNFNAIGDGALMVGGSLLGLIGARGFGGVAQGMMLASREAKKFRNEQIQSTKAAMEAALQQQGVAKRLAQDAKFRAFTLAGQRQGTVDSAVSGFTGQNVSAAQKALADQMAALDKKAASASDALTAATLRQTDARTKLNSIARTQATSLFRERKAMLENAEAALLNAERQRAAARTYYDMNVQGGASAKKQEAAYKALGIAHRNEMKAQADLLVARNASSASLSEVIAKNKQYKKVVAELNAATAARNEASKVQAVTALAAQQTRLNMLTAAGTLTEAQSAKVKQLNERLEKRIAAATMESAAAKAAVTAATIEATAATAAYNAAIARTTIAARAGALAVRGFSASLAFVGGPFGAALLAVGAAMTVISVRTHAAEEQAERYSAAIKIAGEESYRAADKIRAAAAEMAQPKEGDNLTVLQGKLNVAERDVTDFFRKLTQITSLAVGGAIDPLIQRVGLLGQQLRDKGISLQEFLRETDKLTKENPGRAGIIQYFQDLARMADAARGTVDTLSKAVERLDGQEANVTIVVKQKMKGGSAFNATGNFMDNENLKYRMAEDQDDTFIGKLLKEGEQAAKSARSEAAEARRAAADERRRLKDEAKKANDKEVSSNIEKYIEGIAELKNSGAEVFMSDMDQKIIATARSMGIAEDEIRHFINSTKGIERVSTDFEGMKNATEGVPARFQAIAYELERIAENEKIKEFIDGAADAFGNLFQSIMDGSMSTSEALKRFGMDILKMAQQIYVVEPAMRMFRNFFSGFGGMGGGFTGQGGFGTATDIWAGLRVPSAHDGWTVGSGKAPGSKVVSPLAFAGAKKFHGGLGNDEFAAILEKGERVLTADQAGAAMNVIAGAVGAGGGGNTVVNVYNNSGAPVSEKRRKSDGVDIVDIVVGAFNQGASMGKVDGVMGDRYGAKKRRRAR